MRQPEFFGECKGFADRDHGNAEDHVVADFSRLACAGAEPGDIVQNAYGYGLFTGGLGFHYGALTMGLTVIPTSSDNDEAVAQG